MNLLGIISLVSASVMTVSAWAQTTVGPVSIDDAGVVTIGKDINARVNLFDGHWARTAQSKEAIKGSPKKDAGKWSLTGTFQAKGITTPFEYSETVSGEGNRAKYEGKLTAAEDVDVNTVALVVQLPVAKFKGQTVSFGDKEVVLPDAFSGSQDVFQSDEIASITIPLPDGKKLKITGPVDVYVQDDRRFQGTSYTMRLFFKPRNGSFKKGDSTSVSVAFELSGS